MSDALDPDDALMAQVAREDRAAFARVLARHEAIVRRVCKLLLRDASHGDELAQEVFLTLWLERKRYQPRGQLRAYLCTMARNRCLSVLRRRRLATLFLIRQSDLHAPGMPPTPPAPGRGAELLAALEALPEQFRLPLHLRFVEDLDYPEIALVIGRTVSATRSRIHYGLKALRASVDAASLKEEGDAS